MTKMEKAFAIAVNVFERARAWEAFAGSWSEFIATEIAQLPEVKAHKKAYNQRRKNNALSAPL